MNRKNTVRILAIVLLVVTLGAVVIGCAGMSTDHTVACEVVDSSKSTRYVQPHYEEILEGDAGEVADEGGLLVALVITGDPRVESIPEEADFADLTGVEKEGQRSSAIRLLLDEVDSEMRASALGGENPSSGSGIIGGIDLLGDRGDCDSITALSDGLETAAFHAGNEGVVSVGGRERIVQRLQANGLVPDLNGIDLAFPLGGVLPQGTDMSPANLVGVREFWSLYAETAGTTLIWRVE